MGKVSIFEVAGKLINVTCETINYIGNSFFMTEQNLSKIVKKQTDSVSKELRMSKKIEEHRVSIEGINIDNNKINLEIFSTFTSKPKHDVDLKKD